MTSRERLVTAARGGEVDQKPVLVWPGRSASIESDAQVVSGLDGAISDDKAVLVQVVNPFGRALAKGIDLNKELDADPSEGDKVLQFLKQEVIDEGLTALEQGADGILYVLLGARGTFCTPMQYGGHYLEVDREILQAWSEARLNIVFVAGNDDVYIDFVSDLPAHLFAWDVEASTFDAAYVRTLRSGAQLSSDPESEVRLVTALEPGQNLAALLEKEPVHAI